MRPERGFCDGGVAAFVAGEERAAVEYVALEPNVRGEGRADGQRVSAQRLGVDEDFEAEAFQVQVDPVKLGARERVRQGLEGDDAAREAPVVLVRGARGRGLFERLPARRLASL